MLRLHRSERADALVAPLADVLAVVPDDPFAVDVVAVPTRGVERWLAVQGIYAAYHAADRREAAGRSARTSAFAHIADLISVYMAEQH